MWHPEAVERLARPLKDSLIPERHLADFLDDPLHEGPATQWADRIIRNHLNKHAGTATDPLKDVEIPFGEGVKRWEEVMDTWIHARPLHPREQAAEGARPEESIWQIETPNALQSYLSHVGDYLRQNVRPEKLQQYDLVRAVKETAAWDKKMAAEMEKGMSRSHSARMPPTQPSGTPVKTRRASMTLR